MATSVRIHATVYVAVNVFLIAVWALTGGGYFWPIWVILGWGLGLACHAAPLVADRISRVENELIDELLADAGDRMKKSVESTRGELATVRTGRASPHLLDRINVDYYGTSTPLKQLSNIAATDARLLTLTPYDKSSIGAIEKAILESDVGLTPNNDGNVIRLQIPEMTEERRREMVKVVHGVAEEGKVAVRNVRRDVMHDLRELKKDGDAGEDDERRAEEALQKLTDDATGEIDALLKGKEEEILEV